METGSPNTDSLNLYMNKKYSSVYVLFVHLSWNFQIFWNKNLTVELWAMGIFHSLQPTTITWIYSILHTAICLRSKITRPCIRCNNTWISCYEFRPLVWAVCMFNIVAFFMSHGSNNLRLLSAKAFSSITIWVPNLRHCSTIESILATID